MRPPSVWPPLPLQFELAASQTAVELATTELAASQQHVMELQAGVLPPINMVDRSVADAPSFFLFAENARLKKHLELEQAGGAAFAETKGAQKLQATDIDKNDAGATGEVCGSASSDGHEHHRSLDSQYEVVPPRRTFSIPSTVGRRLPHRPAPAVATIIHDPFDGAFGGHQRVLLGGEPDTATSSDDEGSGNDDDHSSEELFRKDQR